MVDYSSRKKKMMKDSQKREFNNSNEVLLPFTKSITEEEKRNF